MAWGASTEKPTWLSPLQRDDPALTELAVLRSLDAHTWASVAAALADSTRLRVLIAHKKLETDTLRALATACSSSRLESVSIGTRDLGDSGAAILLPALACCATLRSCDLESRGLGDASVDGILQLLDPASAACLTTLNIARNEALSGAGVSRVAHAVTGSGITSLDLSSLTIGEDGASALGKMCATSQRLKTLVLKSVLMGPEGAARFAEALKSPALALTALDLSGTALDGGAAPLFRALSAMAPSLTSLGLDRSSLKPEAFAALSGLLALPLKVLRLQGSGLGDDGALQLAHAISERCPPLDELHIGANGVHASAASFLLGACARLPTMRTFDSIGNPLGDDGAQQIAKLIDVDTRGLVGRLALLSLNACEIGMAGFAAIEAALRTRAPTSSDSESASHPLELLTIELAHNPACQDDNWAASIESLRVSRPEVTVVWKALGEDAAEQPSSTPAVPTRA